MPKKVKTRKTIHSTDDLWVAPRAPSEKPPHIYEPIAGSRLNRYLEFADIALGVKQAGSSKKKAIKAGGSPGGEQSGSKTIPINRGSARRGFGAFRNSR